MVLSVFRKLFFETCIKIKIKIALSRQNLFINIKNISQRMVFENYIQKNNNLELLLKTLLQSNTDCQNSFQKTIFTIFLKGLLRACLVTVFMCFVEQKSWKTLENQTNFCFAKSENSFQSKRQVGRNRLMIRKRQLQ